MKYDMAIAKRSDILLVIAFYVAGAFGALGILKGDDFEGDDFKAESPRKTYLFILLHAEDEVALVPSADCPGTFERECMPFLNNGRPAECCLEVLTPLGEKRAELLANWFRKERIEPTHVFASHKLRTLLTVRGIAEDVGLANDGDLVPDGVQQIPPFALECEPGFEIAHLFFLQTVEAIEALPLGSRAVVCGHSGSVYPILEALGIDTSDEIDFPKTAAGRVRGFNNLWIVGIDRKDRRDLEAHLVLDFELAEAKRTRPDD